MAITSYPYLRSDTANNPLGFVGAGRDQYLSSNRADGSFFSVGRNRCYMDAQWTAHMHSGTGHVDFGRFDSREDAVKACESSLPQVLKCHYCDSPYEAKPHQRKPICDSCWSDENR